MRKGIFYQIGFFFAVLAVCTFVYWPSLSGPFLFDDFPNLNPLLSYNSGINSAIEFIFGGSSSALGRPISMASFLIGSESFPHNPWVFKFVNLVIHLSNGVLIYFFTRRLANLTSLSKERISWLAIFCSLCWLLHPFLMSSVLLVVQRMTLLMTFFALASMLTYLTARVQREDQNSFLYLCLYVIFGFFSVLSKENGVLIPLYLLVLEITLLSKLNSEKSNANRNVWVFVKGPVLFVVSYMIYKLPEFIRGYERREFDLIERLLTEPRVVLDYIVNIVVPKLGNTGIFHDNYLISHSLTDPISTLFAIVVIVLLLVSALYLREKKPIYAMAVLFFFAGHLIESTVVPLEIYFEHRNYLPSIGLIFGGAYFVFSKIPKVKVLSALLVTYLVLIGGISYLNGMVWGSLSGIARVWAVENPESVRAQMLLARYYGDVQRYDLARVALKNAIKLNPSDIPLQFELIVNECLLTQKVEQQSLVTAGNIIGNGSYSHGISNSLTVLVKMLGDKLCEGITPQSLSILIEAALANKSMTNTASRQTLYFQLGEIQLYQGLYEEAMNSYDQLHRLIPNADLYVMQIKVSFTLGKLEQAEYYLSQLKAVEGSRPAYKKSYQGIIDKFSSMLSGVNSGKH